MIQGLGDGVRLPGQGLQLPEGKSGIGDEDQPDGFNGRILVKLAEHHGSHMGKGQPTVQSIPADPGAFPAIDPGDPDHKALGTDVVADEFQLFDGVVQGIALCHGSRLYPDKGDSCVVGVPLNAGKIRADAQQLIPGNQGGLLRHRRGTQGEEALAAAAQLVGHVLAEHQILPPGLLPWRGGQGGGGEGTAQRVDRGDHLIVQLHYRCLSRLILS